MDENPYKAPQSESEALPASVKSALVRRVICHVSGITFALSAVIYGYCLFADLIGPATTAHWTTLTFLAGTPAAFLHPQFQGRLWWFRWVWVAACVGLLAQSIYYLV